VTLVAIAASRATLYPPVIAPPLVTDTTAPAFASAQISNATPSVINVTMTEALSGTLSAVSAFTVTVDGIGATLSSNASVDATHFNLTLATPVTFGQSVLVLYTKPALNPLKDAVGNETASFSGSVSNTVLGVGSSPITNGGFETPAIAAASYSYAPTGSTWGCDNAGITNVGSLFGPGPIPEGTQCGFIQGQAPPTGHMSQTFDFAAGTYAVSLYLAKRVAQMQPIQVAIDGIPIGVPIKPASSDFNRYVTEAFTVTAGPHTLSLSCTLLTGGGAYGDKTTFVDDVQIIAPTTSGGPVFTPVYYPYLILADNYWDAPSSVAAVGSFRTPWVTAGGDYAGTEGTHNGGTPYASASFVTVPSNVDFTVTTLVAYCLTHQGTGFLLKKGGGSVSIASRYSSTPPTLTVVTTNGTFDCPCKASTHGGIPTEVVNVGAGSVGMLRFDCTGVTGTLSSATMRLRVTAGSASSLDVYRLVMPLVCTSPATDFPDEIELGIADEVDSYLDLDDHADRIEFINMSSEGAIRSWATSLDGADPSIGTLSSGGDAVAPGVKAYPSYAVDATYGFSMVSLPAWGGYGSGPRNVQWIKAITPRNEAYLQYAIRIHEDVRDAFNEEGMKLPGLGNPAQFSIRLWHGSVSEANPHLYRWAIYRHSPGHDATVTGVEYFNIHDIYSKAGQRYLPELRVKVNTTSDGWATYNSDGIIEAWMDGVLCHRETGLVLQTANYGISVIDVVLFHGGSNPPVTNYVYELG
jgi:hypothetical protein